MKIAPTLLEILRRIIIALIKIIEWTCLALEWLYFKIKPFTLRIKGVDIHIKRHYLLTAIMVVVFIFIMITKCANSGGVRLMTWRATSINQLITNEMSDIEAMESFDKEMRTFLRRWDVTGASFALMRNDSLIYAKGYGYADLESKTECDVKHLFRIASVSKLFTATAIMQLVEQNKISLDSKVFGEEGVLCDSMFLNIKDRNVRRITVDHLLRHTAGFSYPLGDPAFNNWVVAADLDKPQPISLDDMVLYATRNKLRYTPGDHFEYSNLGYILLGKIIEEVTGIGYERYVQEYILTPAKCYDIFVGESCERASNEVNYYEVKEAKPINAYDGSGDAVMRSDGGNNIPLLGAAGGWVASPVELLRFVASINGDPTKSDILSKESIKTMTYDSSRYKPIGWASVSKTTWIRTGSMAGTSAIVKRQGDGYTWALVVNKSPWIGYKFNNYASTQITRSLSKIKNLPQRDLFSITKEDLKREKEEAKTLQQEQ